MPPAADLVIASDIDGTLLRTDHTVSERSRRAIERVEEAGHTFVLVTGRPPRWLAPIREQVAHRGLAICANGAIVLDLHTDEVVAVDAFADGTGRQVLEAVRRLDETLVFGVEWADGFAHETGYAPGIRQSELARGAAQEVPTTAELFDRPVVKILARMQADRDAADLEALADLAVHALGDTATVTFSSTRLLEISAPGITKASALERFVGERGGEADRVVAFGDQPNDLPMIQWAGQGVAVANAHQLVREVADEVTTSNDDDGVAVVIERILG